MKESYKSTYDIGLRLIVQRKDNTLYLISEAGWIANGSFEIERDEEGIEMLCHTIKSNTLPDGQMHLLVEYKSVSKKDAEGCVLPHVRMLV